MMAFDLVEAGGSLEDASSLERAQVHKSAFYSPHSLMTSYSLLLRLD